MHSLFHAAIAVGLTGCLATNQNPSEDDPSPESPPGATGQENQDPNATPLDPTRPDPGGTPCEDHGPPVTPRLRRLTFAQYDRTISELVGFAVTPSADLGPEVDAVTSVLWEGVQVAAAGIAQRVIAEGRLDALLPCEARGDGSECARRFAEHFGRRAYRRPLTEAELASYDALYADRAELTETGTFEEGIELLLEVFLQAPSLLLRIENSTAVVAGRIAVSGWEIATRLSYALWNGPPDELLLRAAELGELESQEGVRREALRMLSSDEGMERARPMIRASHREWLGMEGEYAQFWSNTQRDPEAFPEFYAGIDADFREEMLRFVDRIVLDDGGTFRDLFTSPKSVVNGPLSRIYGYDGSFGDEWVELDLDPAQRPGLLTRAGFVGTHGRYGRGSLIFRGAFVLKRMLCIDIGSPPPGAESTPLPETSDTLRTTRDRIVAMTSAPACAGCHQTLINPAGFGLEHFDGIGRHRDQENGAPIDATGKIWLDGGEQAYSGPAEYGELVAASKSARECYVERFTEFTFGDAGLGCTEQALAERLGEDGVTIKDFLAELVATDAFRFRSMEEAE